MRRSLLTDIERMARDADEEQLAVLERMLEGDTRKGARLALDKARRRLDAERQESERLGSLYTEAVRAASAIDAGVGLDAIIGLDEVGRGCLAGPLAVGAVVLDPNAEPIGQLDDSKRLKPEVRERVAREVRERSLAWHVECVDASTIDDAGISGALRMAFSNAIAAIEEKGIDVRAVLLDGNPMRIDPREVNVVKGDSRCAPISAASVVAKVERDSLMQDLAQGYPGYGFDSNKGYGTDEHRDAIKELGLTDIHRRSFCSEFLQETLF